MAILHDVSLEPHFQASKTRIRLFF